MEQNTQMTSPAKTDSFPISDPGINKSYSSDKSSQSNKYKMPLIMLSVFIGFMLFGVGGYILGMQRGSQESVINNSIVPTQAPLTTTQSLPTSNPVIDPNTELLEPSLVTTDGWRTVSFPQNIIVSQGGDVRSGNLEMMIPSDWTTTTVQTRTGVGIGGGACNDFHLSSANGDTLLVIMPGCGDSNNDYLPISGKVQKIELITDKGNDHHDSHTVRYYETTTNIYYYGEIGVSPGASIDIQKDQIYPNLILQYEPDRIEQWLWTSYNLTYSGNATNQQIALNTADTIVSTLKLTD